MKKKRVFRKTCATHGEYIAPGPRSKCPLCKPKEKSTAFLAKHAEGAKYGGGEKDTPQCGVKGKDGKVLAALVEMGLVREATVRYLRGLV